MNRREFFLKIAATCGLALAGGAAVAQCAKPKVGARWDICERAVTLMERAIHRRMYKDGVRHVYSPIVEWDIRGDRVYFTVIARLAANSTTYHVGTSFDFRTSYLGDDPELPCEMMCDEILYRLKNPENVAAGLELCRINKE